MGGVFWSVYVSPLLSGPEAVRSTLEQIDLVRNFAAKYPQHTELALSSAQVRRIHSQGKIASMIGVEGGHQIDGSLSILRTYYALGARYMTLVHARNLAWVDSATDNPKLRGLSAFGEAVIAEMNRIGMLVDLSHVSADVMRHTLKVTEAPVIFSHSSARALVDHPRNVPDDVLRLVAKNGGVVMINFTPEYISYRRLSWMSDRAAELARLSSPPWNGLYVGQPDKVAGAMRSWDSAHPKPPVYLTDVADHIDHVRRIAGVDHVGIGSDFDGVEDLPSGLEGAEALPSLLEELARRGWSKKDLSKVAGENILRVLAAAEQVAADHYRSSASDMHFRGSLRKLQADQ